MDFLNVRDSFGFVSRCRIADAGLYAHQRVHAGCVRRGKSSVHGSFPTENPADLRDDDRAPRLHDRRTAVRRQDLGLQDVSRVPRPFGGQEIDGRASRRDDCHQSQSDYNGPIVRPIRSCVTRVERRRSGGVLPSLCHVR